MTAAVYAARAGKRAAVFERSIPGGQILRAAHVENYPGFNGISGAELSQRVAEQAEALGAEFIYARVEKVDLTDAAQKTVRTAVGDYRAPALIIATGRGERRLNLKNEDELVGGGVSYCAECDGAFFKGRTVAVAGAGLTAVNDARYLSAIAKKVYLIGGRRLPEIGLSNVEPVENAKITALNGPPLKSIVLERGGKTEILEADGLFVALGSAPDSSLVRGVLDLDGAGYIKTDSAMRTNVSGVFAAGDVRVAPLRQLVTAASDGAIAATGAASLVNKNNKGDRL
jgi:thioredoxin reductase (NADPH)